MCNILFKIFAALLNNNVWFPEIFFEKTLLSRKCFPAREDLLCSYKRWSRGLVIWLWTSHVVVLQRTPATQAKNFKEMRQKNVKCADWSFLPVAGSRYRCVSCAMKIQWTEIKAFFPDTVSINFVSLCKHNIMSSTKFWMARLGIWSYPYIRRSSQSAPISQVGFRKESVIDRVGNNIHFTRMFIWKEVKAMQKGDSALNSLKDEGNIS